MCPGYSPRRIGIPSQYIQTVGVFHEIPILPDFLGLSL
jgi:hypothetical protein